MSSILDRFKSFDEVKASRSKIDATAGGYIVQPLQIDEVDIPANPANGMFALRYRIVQVVSQVPETTSTIVCSDGASRQFVFPASNKEGEETAYLINFTKGDPKSVERAAGDLKKVILTLHAARDLPEGSPEPSFADYLNPAWFEQNIVEPEVELCLTVSNGTKTSKSKPAAKPFPRFSFTTI